MTGTKAFRSGIRIAIAVVTMVVGIAPAGFGQDRPGVPSEGIKVHGHWTLTIRNADGSVDRQIEFENALVPAGATLLARLLMRSDALTTAHRWRISVGGPAATYDIYEGIVPVDAKGANDFEGLTVAIAPGGTGFLLVGSARASVPQSITAVSTALAEVTPKGTINATPFTGQC